MRMPIIVSSLAAALAMLTSCSSGSGGPAADAANCGPAADVYAAVGSERVLGSYDGQELYTAWRDDTGLFTLVRATKNGACIVHVGRELGPYIPL